MSKKQIIKSATPKLSDNALEVVKKRYLKVDEKGNVLETPEEMFYRVASYMAQADKNYEKKAEIEKTTQEFYKILAKLKFLPGGRVLFESDSENTGQLSSCFVVPIEDSLDSIFESLQNAALIQKNNGGTGFNFSNIRPKGDKVKNISNVAAGPVHYLKTFDVALSEIMQGSKRHGANMGILNINHPDILEFIHLKDTSDLIKNFNLSVGVTNDFMEKVRNDEEYDLINPRNKKKVRRLSAREVFNHITQKAWECADPGIIFLDRLEADNPTPELGRIEATNPCGEQPLLPYESCNLGSIVLSEHVKKNELDWDDLGKTVRTAIHFMDNMIDVNKYPLLVIEKNVKKTRKIGLGVMGFAQMLYSLGIPYNSEEATELIEKIMKFVQIEGRQKSVEMAQERGVFPAYEGSTFAKQDLKLRNSTITTIAPNGTISLVANTSSGVEPVFALVNMRRVFYEDNDNKEGGQTMTFVDPVFEKAMRAEGCYNQELMEEVAAKGSIQQIKGIPEKIKKVFVTAHDISYDWHIKIQAASQKYTDNAVSKTINFPNKATVEQVRKAYILAYEQGCKGVTSYRDGCKEAQVISAGVGKKKEQIEPTLAKPAEKTTEEKLSEKIEQGKIPLTENALTVLEKRALKKNKKGEVVETPEQLVRRTARVIASADKIYKVPKKEIEQLEEDFYDILSKLEFLSGQALRNTAEEKLTFSACFVLPITDSMEGIMEAMTENVLVHKATGGTGFNFSHLRSRNSKVGSTGEIASGPISFLKAFDATQETIRTKGGRKQGSMAILNIDHPDVEEFICAKDEEGILSNFNISVGANGKFMKAVQEDKELSLVDPYTNKVVKKIDARILFDKIVDHAWKSGDPGLIFLDRVERDNPTPSLGKLEATNPCGEQPLLPYESCNLGSIVLSKILKEVKNDVYEIDYEKLKRTVHLAVHFLDNTIDLNHFPLEKIEELTKANRKIGLGVMGFADMLIKMNIPYNSEKAVEIAEEVMKFISEQAHTASQELAKQKGSFANFKKSVWPDKGMKHMRNAAVTTIAPTGYTSIVANCSSGIEPLFALVYKRQSSLGGVEQIEVNSLFEQRAKKQGFYTPELMKKIEQKGSVQEFGEVPDDIKKVFAISHDISPEWDLKIQAAFQKYTDNAVSKTINFPKEATRGDVAKVYQMAYDLGCKGITIYRYGSKETQVLSTGDGSSKSVKVVPASTLTPRERPNVTRGSTYKIKTAYGNLYVTINDDKNGKPFEVFATIGKAGGFFAAKSEAICRMISLSLRSGIAPKDVIEQLKGIRGPMPSWGKKGMILSIPDAIAQVFEEHLQKEQQQLSLDYKQAEPEPAEKRIQEEDITPGSSNSQSEVKANIADMGLAPECPDCGSVLEFGEGCMVCRSCGYSKCG